MLVNELIMDGDSCVFIEQRKIRSAGRTTGSVELTLPPEFLAFSGEQTEIFIIEGVNPKIVLTPVVTSILDLLTQLRNCICAGFGLPERALEGNAVQFVTGSSHFGQDGLKVGLKECGMVMAGKFSARGLPDAGCLLSALVQMVLAEAAIADTIEDRVFLGKAAVYIVFGDSNQLDLFELDTIHNALPDFSKQFNQSGEGFSNRATWQNCRANLTSILNDVVSQPDTSGSVGDRRSHWVRAERIASRIL